MRFFRERRRNKAIVIQEYYRDYKPPFPIKPVIRRLLRSVPEPLLVGLKFIVLTNSGTLNRGKRRQKLKSRGQRYSSRDCLGWYSQKWGEDPASIDILVDNVLAREKNFGLRLNLYRDMIFGYVLYHEIGHHIHQTKHPEYKEKEDVADAWRKRLEHRHIWHRYWYYRMVLPLVGPVVGMGLAVAKWMKGR